MKRTDIEGYNIGKRVREICELKNYNFKKFKIKSVLRYYSYERCAKFNPRFPTLDAVARDLNVPFSVLVGAEYEKGKGWYVSIEEILPLLTQHMERVMIENWGSIAGAVNAKGKNYDTIRTLLRKSGNNFQVKDYILRYEEFTGENFVKAYKTLERKLSK